jgi:hypothetical protein
MLLQELPTKVVRHVIRSVTWAEVEFPYRPSAPWRNLYYLMQGAWIVLLRKVRTWIARLGR